MTSVCQSTPGRVLSYHIQLHNLLRGSLINVDMDAFEIGKLELPYGALFQDREARLPLRTESQGLRYHHGIRACDVFHVAFDCLNAFDLEAEMFESWWFWIVPDK